MIVLIEDNNLLNYSLSLILRKEEFELKTFLKLIDAITFIKENRNKIDLIISDIRLPDGSGEQLLKLFPDIPILLMTAYGDVQHAIECINKGAKDYILKPFSNDDFLLRVKRILNSHAQISKLKADLRKEFIGTSKKTNDIIERIEKACKSDATVLITGESGTGKSLVASLIHKYSKRKNAPFITVNCAALPKTLIESELFGYEKGAFTGADKTRIGKLEYANEGTLFLDEIGDLEPELQILLLRFLQDRTFERIGSNKTISVDVRIIAATNKNVEKLVKNGKLREDLFYRLNVIRIHIPPLRERTEDILPLWNYFNEKKGLKLNAKIKTYAKEVIEFVKSYPWYGNVREIENIIEKIYAMIIDDYVSFYDFFKIMDIKSVIPVTSNDTEKIEVSFEPYKMREVISKIERKYILWALEKTNYNKLQAAKLLGISRTALINKIEKLKIL